MPKTSAAVVKPNIRLVLLDKKVEYTTSDKRTEIKGIIFDTPSFDMPVYKQVFINNTIYNLLANRKIFSRTIKHKNYMFKTYDEICIDDLKIADKHNPIVGHICKKDCVQLVKKDGDIVELKYSDFYKIKLFYDPNQEVKDLGYGIIDTTITSTMNTTIEVLDDAMIKKIKKKYANENKERLFNLILTTELLKVKSVFKLKNTLEVLRDKVDSNIKEYKAVKEEADKKEAEGDTAKRRRKKNELIKVTIDDGTIECLTTPKLMRKNKRMIESCLEEVEGLIRLIILNQYRYYSSRAIDQLKELGIVVEKDKFESFIKDKDIENAIYHIFKHNNIDQYDKNLSKIKNIVKDNCTTTDNIDIVLEKEKDINKVRIISDICGKLMAKYYDK